MYVYACASILTVRFSLSATSSFSSFFENLDQNPFFPLVGPKVGPLERGSTVFSVRPPTRTQEVANWARRDPGGRREAVEAQAGSRDVKVEVDSFRELPVF